MSQTTIDSDIELQTEEKVIENFQKTCLYDPFPFIPAALLNHADIKKYIYSTGILFPYNSNNLTGATYKIPLLGDVYYWETNENNELVKKHIKLDNESVKNGLKIILKKNSITYIHISTTFRVPYYLVYRFNLTVSLAQKGLLLGTGPIIDPGFEGRIMIPIHNLTANNYELKAGSGLIRVEFTKLSSNKAFDIKNGTTLDTYKYTFPQNGTHWDEDKYFQDINGKNSIISSIPGSIKNAEDIALKAQEKAINAEKSLNSIKKIAWVSAIIALIGIAAAIIYPTWTLINDTNIASTKLVENNEKMSQKIDNIEKELNNIKNQKK